MNKSTCKHKNCNEPRSFSRNTCREYDYCSEHKRLHTKLRAIFSNEKTVVWESSFNKGLYDDYYDFDTEQYSAKALRIVVRNCVEDLISDDFSMAESNCSIFESTLKPLGSQDEIIPHLREMFYELKRREPQPVMMINSIDMFIDKADQCWSYIPQRQMQKQSSSSGCLSVFIFLLIPATILPIAIRTMF